MLEMPGLLQVPAGYFLHDDSAFPHWRTFLAATSADLNIDHSLEAQLGRPLPLANTLEDSAEAATWLLAAPVHLKADINNAILIPFEASVAQTFMHSVLDAFNQWFEGQLLLREQDGLFYLGVKQVEVPPDLPELRRVQGRKLEQFLHTAPEWRNWRKLWNEIQMFLHQWSAEADTNSPLVCNSLWLWGHWQTGELPSLSGPVHTDDALERASLQKMGAEVAEAAEWTPSSQHLRYLGLHAELVFEDWQAQMQWLEETVIQTVLTANRPWQLHCEGWQGEGRRSWLQRAIPRKAPAWKSSAALQFLDHEL